MSVQDARDVAAQIIKLLDLDKHPAEALTAMTIAFAGAIHYLSDSDDALDKALELFNESVRETIDVLREQDGGQRH